MARRKLKEPNRVILKKPAVHVIGLSTVVYDHLRKHKQGEERPNDTVRRLLGLPEAEHSPYGPSPKWPKAGRTKSIRVDDVVFKFLQKKATPLVDKASDVLARLLDLSAKKPKKSAN